MIKFDNKIGIFGAGGFGKETMCYIMDCLSDSKHKIEDIAVFVVDDKYYSEKTIFGVPVIPFSDFSNKNHELLIAVGDSIERMKIVNRFPTDTRFTTLIHPRAVVSKFTEIGEGSIIAPGAIVSCDTQMGKHAHINYNATIGHDCTIGDFFTASPGVNISGKCRLEECVFFGANATIKEKLSVNSNATIGMGAVVVKDITEAGVYIGNPARKLERN